MSQKLDTKKLIGIGAVLAVVIAGAIAFFAGSGSDKSETEQQVAEAAANTESAADASGSNVAETEGAAKPAEAPANANDPVVAKVDGSEIKRSTVLAFMQTLPPMVKQMPIENLYPLALDEVVKQQIVQLKASETDLSGSEEVAKRMEEAKIQIVRAVYLEKEIEKNLSESRLKDAYNKFKDDQGKVQEVRASHILVESKEKAEEIIKNIADGQSFAELAQKNSKDESNKAKGGDLGYFAKESMVKEFGEAAFAMSKGDVSKEPVKTQFGWHVINVTDKRARPVPAFEEVKAALAVQERREILGELLNKWRKKADVETFDLNGQPMKAAEKQSAEKAEAAAPASVDTAE